MFFRLDTAFVSMMSMMVLTLALLLHHPSFPPWALQHVPCKITPCVAHERKALSSSQAVQTVS